MRQTAIALALAACLAVPETARAEPTTSPPPAPATTWRTTGTWGWAVLGAGMAVGAGLSTYGLSLDCSDTDRACQRGASIAIWGGIGLAMLSSAIGLAIVQDGRRRVQLVPAVYALGAEPRGGLVLSANF